LRAAVRPPEEMPAVTMTVGCVVLLASAVALPFLSVGMQVAGLLVIPFTLLLFAAPGVFRPIRRRGAWLAMRGRAEEMIAGAMSYEGAAGRDLHPEWYRLPRSIYYLGMLLIAQTAFLIHSLYGPSDWIFLLAVIVLVPECLARRDMRLPLAGSLLWGIGMLLAGGVLSSWQSVDPTYSLLYVAKFFILMVVWFWTGAMVLRTPDHIRTAMSCWVLSAAVAGAAAAAQVTLGVDIPGAMLAWGRASGTTTHMNELGLVSAMAIMPALILTGYAGRWATKFLFATASMGIVAGLVFSVSLSGVGAALIALGTAIVLFGRLRSLARPAALVLALLVAFFCVRWLAFQEANQLPNVVERISGVVYGSSEEDSVESRIATYRVAWRRIERNPFVGVGFSPSDSRTAAGLRVHNILLKSWYEGGLLSICGIALIIGSILWQTWRIASGTGVRDEWWLAEALLLSAVAFIVFSMSAPLARHRDTWVFAALAVALYRVHFDHIRGAFPRATSVS